MKKGLLFLAIAAMLLVFTSCKPDVEACFTSTINDDVVTFASTCSVEATAYQWDFGDGGTSIAPSPVHTYAASGSYVVALQVADKKGHTSTASETISIVTCSVTCVHGHCVSGACDCDNGYEGADCSTAVNAKFGGTYSMNETCNQSGSAPTYAVTIVLGSTPTAVNFVGLWEVPQLPVGAEVGITGTTFTIGRQQLTSGFDVECTNGTITSDGQTINMTYGVYRQGPDTLVDLCTAVLTK